MAQTFHGCFDPLIGMNRRVSIGTGVLVLIPIAESAAVPVRPFG